jgi:hypothetical protein
MDHPSCLELDNEESEERSKEEISHLQEVTGPHLRRMIVYKGSPLLSSWSWCVNLSHVLLDGSLAHPNAQFQEFSTNPLSAPQSILRRHLPNQGDGFCGYLRLMRNRL